MKLELDLAFLERLLGAVGPTGFEDEAARVWCAQAETFADRVERDTHGNAYAQINPGGTPRLMLAGHIDEIGVIVTHIDDDGYVYFQGLGGWDPQVLVGQRLRFLGTHGSVLGVVGRKPIHLLEAAEREKAVKIDELWADIGAKDGAEARAHLEVGAVGVIAQPLERLLGRRVASKAIDNRIGAFAVLEALRHLKAAGVTAEVTAVATVQEEIGAYGARTAAYRLRPDTALVVDVTFCSRQPGVDKKKWGEAPLGSGANLAVGPFVHPKVLRRLRELADREKVPYTLAAHWRFSGTDADEIALVREGVPSAVVSIPNRYMHSPSEVVDLGDVEAVVRLLALYAQAPLTDLVR